MDADLIYSKLVASFRNRDDKESLRVCAKLILELVTQIGDQEKLEEIIAATVEPAKQLPDFGNSRHFGYFRSTADFRLRIAMNLKGVTTARTPIHLAKGEQHEKDYAKLNLSSLVPALEINGEVFAQSLALIEYLNTVIPQPDLVPGDAIQQLRIRSFAQTIACDIHPLNNLRVQKYLRGHGFGDEDVQAWIDDWLRRGFTYLEEKAARWRGSSRYLFGDQPTLAELCLIPQMYNARRFKSDLSPYPILCEVDELCMQHRAFKAAAPSAQADCDVEQA